MCGTMQHIRRAIIGFVMIFAAAQAHAGSSGTTDAACGYTSATANLPAGAVGLSNGDGPIRSILESVGEYRTHSLISHGNGWYTHSTMYTPGRPGWPDYCSTPLEPSELQNGYPGASQVNEGGLYVFYHQPGGDGPTSFYYQRSLAPNAAAGDAIQSWLWYNAPYAWVGSRQDGGNGFYRVGFGPVNGPNTPYTQYVLYQYRNMEGIAAGSGWTYDYGNVCSTYLAYAQNQAGFGTISNSNTYSHLQVVSGINALYSAVEDQCNNSTGFWADVGAGITCLEGICDDAARQTANCFTDGANGSCYTDDSRYYTRVRDANLRDGSWSGWNKGPYDQAGYATAVAVSPDAIGGWNGHPWGTQAPNPVWSADGNNTAQWNSPGNVYGCFF
jgi:hypothetical protein